MKALSLPRLILPLALILGLPAVGAYGTAAAAAPEKATATSASEPTEEQILLALLDFDSGVTVQFDYGTDSQDFGLIQDGEMDVNSPIVRDDGASLLENYLDITPRTVSVPRLLISSHPTGEPLPRELGYRTITDEVVKAKGLAAPLQAQAGQSCWDLYWNSYHWYVPASYPNPSDVYRSAKTYYASQFGGMKRFSYSYVANCVSSGVRHRVYYKSFGNYYKHHDATVGYFKWQAVKKGSVHRYRKVHYDANYSYTRNGRFFNS